MIKGCLIHLRGLGDSNPNGQWCGARPHAERLVAKHSLDLIDANWNDSGIREIVDRARAAGYYFVAIGGHSHGAGEAAAIANRYGFEALDHLHLIDDCPFGDVTGHLLPPRDFPDSPRFGYAVWQRNMEPAGIKFRSRLGVAVADANTWDPPKIGHVDFGDLASIAGDVRTWDGIDAQLTLARAAREPPPASPLQAHPDDK